MRSLVDAIVPTPKDDTLRIDLEGGQSISAITTDDRLMIDTFSLIKRAKQVGGTPRPWLLALMARQPTKAAAIALANKTARIAWAMMVPGTRYIAPIVNFA